MIDKFKIEFENARNQVIEIYGSPYKLISFVGLGEVGADIQTYRAPYQDGAFYLDSILQPRYIDFELKIQGTSNRDIEWKRQQLANVFNPKLGPGTLRYISDTMVREIKCVALSVPSFPDGTSNRHRTFQKAIIQLMCPRPYWTSQTIITEKLSSFIPLFQFPFEGEFQMGMEGSELLINNTSDFPLPIQIKLEGPSSNPKIFNTSTGEYIRVKRDLLAGDILLIDTDEKTVTLNGTDAFPYIDLSSSFFELQLGPNIITYTADSGTEDAQLEISYRELYSSI